MFNCPFVTQSYLNNKYEPKNYILAIVRFLAIIAEVNLLTKSNPIIDIVRFSFDAKDLGT